MMGSTRGRAPPSCGAEGDLGQRHLAVVGVGRVGYGDDPDRDAVHDGRRLEAVLRRAPQARRRRNVARLVEARLGNDAVATCAACASRS